MKRIVENWRKWKNFPADGHSPVKQKLEDEENQLPLVDDTEERGAPIKNRNAIQHLSSSSRELRDPETGEVDYDKVYQYIDNSQSSWGPEGDPERDLWLNKRSKAIQDAIDGLKDMPELSPEEEKKLARFEADIEAIQRILKRQNPEFHSNMEKIDPYADTENTEGETFASPNKETLETAPDLPYWGPKWRKS